jgi:hypothetical protein
VELHPPPDMPPDAVIFFAAFVIAWRSFFPPSTAQQDLLYAHILGCYCSAYRFCFERRSALIPTGIMLIIFITIGIMPTSAEPIAFIWPERSAVR